MPLHGDHRRLKDADIPFDNPSNMQLVLESMQDAGAVPKKYANWAELTAAYERLLAQGLKPAQARNALDIKTYTNIFDKRQIRTMIPSMLQDYITKKHGEDVWKEYKKYANTTWNKEASRDAQRLEKQTGQKFDRGHLKSAKLGGPTTRANQLPEPARLNRRSDPTDTRLPEADRFPQAIMEDMGAPMTQVQGFEEWRLQKTGAPPRSGIKGKPSHAIPILADEGVISPEQIPVLQDKVRELEKQGLNMEEALRERSSYLSKADATKQSGKVADTANNGVIGNGSNGKQAGYTINEWREWLSKQVPIRDLENINGAIRLAASSPGGRLARAVAPSALGAATAALTAADAIAREETYQKDPSLLNRIQRDISRVEVTSDTAGAIPGPQSFVAEPAGLVSGLLNVSIDALRDGTVEKMRQVRSAIRFMP